MKKFLFITFWVLILLASTAHFVWTYRSYLTELFLSRQLGVPITIGKIEVNSKAIQITNLIIYNPPKALRPIALRVESIQVNNPLTSYLKDPILIREVVLKNLFIDIELYDPKGEKSNWHTIFQQSSEDQKKTRSFLSIKRSAIVRDLLLENIHIHLIQNSDAQEDFSPIKKLEFKNIDTKKGVPTKEISNIIIQHVVNSAFIIKGLKAIFSLPKSLLQTLIDPGALYPPSHKGKKGKAEKPSEKSEAPTKKAGPENKSSSEATTTH